MAILIQREAPLRPRHRNWCAGTGLRSHGRPVRDDSGFHAQGLRWDPKTAAAVRAVARLSSLSRWRCAARGQRSAFRSRVERGDEVVEHCPLDSGLQASAYTWGFAVVMKKSASVASSASVSRVALARCADRRSDKAASSASASKRSKRSVRTVGRGDWGCARPCSRSQG